MSGAPADDLFERGLEIRRQVLGSAYVDTSLKAATDFNRPFQEMVTRWCWGDVWGRPGLDRKTTSMLNLAMLSALNRPAELKLHVRGALNNGVSHDEIREVLLQVAVYCGVPSALEGFKIAAAVIDEEAGASKSGPRE